MSQPEFEYLGPYKVEQTLGRGGMGTVYKGIHGKSHEAVAIKVIASSIADSMRFRRRFDSEVETLKRLQHPHIVQLVGYGEEQGMLFYSMEYVEGHSLHDHLRQHERLSWEEVIQIGIETTSALKHAHDFGIIHRDLKPANLLLNTEGHVKLTDFGIAKLFGAMDQMTAPGSVIGTADYMPPEQAEGKPVTVRSDLYSLGGVLYALLTGKSPFGGKSVPEVLYAVRYNEVPNLHDRVAGIPPELAELIHELLQKDPQKRPPTALVVGNRLKSMQQGIRHTSIQPEASEGRRPKEVGTKLTSLDLSDIEDDELKLTGEESDRTNLAAGKPNQETFQSEIPLGTHEQQTVLASDSPHAKSPASDVSVEGQSNDPNSKSALFSGELHSVASEPKVRKSEPSKSGSTAQASAARPSHFTPVEHDIKTTKLGFDAPEQSASVDWLHFASVAGMIAALIATLWLGWWLLRPDSADQLYRQVVAAVDTGDEGQLMQVSGTIEEFLDRFPEDVRSPEMQALANEVELTRWTRILQRRAARTGGLESLTAVEQGFLDCMKLMSQDRQRAELKLAAFVDVFGERADLPRDEKKLVRLAEYALKSGERVAKDSQPVAAEQLEKLIESAEESLTAEQLQPYYENLLLLYGDKPWAAGQMERLRKNLRNNMKTGS